MKLQIFSNCSGHCYTCKSSGICLAGHGEDSYSPATKEQIKERISEEMNSIKDNISNGIDKKDINTIISSLEKLKILIDFI